MEHMQRMRESGRQGERRELLDRLDDAQTPSEVASARAAADSWLVDHPDDVDVRQARERLSPTEGEEDLEEGSPT